MGLSNRDQKECLEIIELIYSVPDQEKMFSLLCERLQRLIGISTGIMARINPERKNIHLRDVLLFNVTERAFILFAEHYAHLHPLPLNQGNLPPNTVQSLNDVISDAELSKTEYSRDFQPQVPTFYEAGAALATQGDPVGIVGFHRPKRDGRFSKREKELMGIIFPHLSRSLQISDLLAGKAADADCGLIELDRNGRVLSMNEEARFALNGRPASLIPNPEHSPGSVFFERGAYCYRVRTVPMHWNSIEKIIILEPCPDRHNLQAKLQAYGLTKRQEEVALFSIRGLVNKEIAEKLSITEQTVRDHLRDIFEKIGVHTRSELTAKVVGLELH